MVQAARHDSVHGNKVGSHSHLDMILVESFDDIVRIEVIIRTQVLSLVLCPLDILLPPSKVCVVIHQTQYQIHSILLGLRDHKVQTLKKNAKQKKDSSAV